MLVGYFANFGLETVAVREAARDPEREHEWIGAVMMLRMSRDGSGDPALDRRDLALQRSHEMLLAGLISSITMPFSGVSALQLLFQLRVNNVVPDARD